MTDFDPDKYLQNANKFDPDAYLKKNRPQKEPTFVENAFDAALSAPSIGERVPILGPLAAKAGTAAATGIHSMFSDKSWGDLYNQEMQRQEQAKAEYSKKHPVADIAQDITAGFAIPAPFGVGQAAKTAPMMTKIGTKAADIAAKAGQIYGVTEADAAIRGVEGHGKTAAGITAAIESAPVIGKAAGKYARKFVFGIPDDVAERYASRGKFINADSEESLKNTIDSTVDKLKKSFESSKEELASAKSADKAAKQIEVSRLAQIKPSADTASSILESARELRQIISQKSSEAFDVLDKYSMSLGGVRDSLNKNIESLKVGGLYPVLGNKEASAKLQQIKELVDNLYDAYPETDGAVPAKVMKQIVQLIDGEIDQGFNQAKFGGYIDRGTRALMEVRKDINTILKTDPEYSALMKDLASDTRLLDEVNKIFKTETQAVNVLKKLDQPEFSKQRETLKNLGSRTKQDFLEAVKSYEGARQILKDPQQLEEYLMSLPSNQRVQELMELYQAAKQKYEPFKGISPKTSQNLIRNVYSEKRPNIQTRRLMEDLGEVAGENLMERAKDVGVKNALERGFTHGSRNVNLGAISLGNLGGMAAGSVGQMFGQTLGGMVGAASDLIGPKTYKTLVDLSQRPEFEKYATILQRAAERGPLALAIMHRNLQNEDERYRRMINQ